MRSGNHSLQVSFVCVVVCLGVFLSKVQAVEFPILFHETANPLSPTGFAAGDLTGDNFPDLFCYEIDHATEYFWIDGAYGCYTEAHEIDIDRECVSTAVIGDVTGDGNADIILAYAPYDDETPEYTLLYILGTPTGPSSDEAIIEDDDYGLRWIELADMDNDGDLDIVGLSSAFGALYVWLNDGTGQFSPQAGIDIVGIQHATLGDMDNDGDLDIVAVVTNDAIGVFYQETLTQYTFQEVEAGFDDGECLNLKDLDGDGDLEIIACGVTDGDTKWWDNTEEGFVGHFLIATHGLYAGAEDMDGDGDPDIVLVTEEAWRIWINDGFGQFTMFSNRTGEFSQQVALIDLAGDGCADMFTIRSHELCIYENDGMAMVNTSTVSTLMSWDVSLVDWDNDNDLDPLVYPLNRNHQALVVYRNDGDMDFTFYGFPGAQNYTMFANPADLDQDGDLDILTADNSAQSQLSWWEHTINITGVFHLIPGFANLTNIQCIDYNDDEAPDFFCVWDSRYVRFYINDGTAGFYTWEEGSVSGVIEMACCADLDNDGDIDVVACGQTNPEETTCTWILENTGDGNFTNHLLPGYYGTPLTGDFDEDNDNDIFILGLPSILLENEGNLSFTSHVIGTPSGYKGKVVDYDSDGDLDVVCTAGYGYDRDDMENVVFWENEGNLSFRRHILVEASHAYNLDVGDLDGDMDVDILLSMGRGLNASQVLCVEQLSEAVFSYEFSLSLPYHNEIITNDTVTVSWYFDQIPLPATPQVFEVFWDTTRELTNGWSATCLEHSFEITGFGDLLAARGLDELPDNTVIYWDVRTMINGQWIWGRGLPRRFAVHVPDPPEPFHLFSPDGDTTLDDRMAFTWYSTSDPDADDEIRYSLCLSSFSDLAEAWFPRTGQRDTAVVWNGFEDDQCYYWTVTATDLTDNVTWALDTLVFFTAFPDPPNSFQRFAPWNDDTVTEDTVTVRWTVEGDPDPGDSVHYMVHWSLDANMGTCDSMETGENWLSIGSVSEVLAALRHGQDHEGIQTYYELNELPDNHTLYWRVKAVDEQGHAVWADSTTEPWCFHVAVGDAPAPFDLVAPNDEEVCTLLPVLFKWQQTSDPDPSDSITYEFWIDTTAVMSTRWMIADRITDTTYTLEDTLEQDRPIYWRVHARDTNTSGRWSSDIFSFVLSVPEPPRPFSLLEPEDHTVIDQEEQFPVVFRWENNGDPDAEDSLTYNFFLCTDSTFHAVDWYYVTRSDSIEFDSLECETYWWRVKAIDTQGLECFSAQTWRLDVTLPVVDDQFSGIPTEFGIAGVYPNPFNNTASVVVGLPCASEISLVVYNIRGQQVATLAQGQALAEGYHTLTLNGDRLASGVYFVKFNAAQHSDIRRVILLK